MGLLVCSFGPTLACARAGTLVWGVEGSNACPAGSSVITDEYQCQAAAATAGKAWSHSGSWSNFPRGCFYYTVNSGVVLNRDATGGANPGDMPLCAVAATGLRSRVCLGVSLFVCACVCLCGATVSVCVSVFFSFFPPFFLCVCVCV